MHYYPFSEFNSEEYHVSTNTTNTLFLCDGAYIDKRFVHGSNEELAEFAVHQGVIDGISDEFAAYRDYLKEVKRRIIDRNATKISEVVEIYKEIGDLK